MKKSLLLALALTSVSLAGCTEKTDSDTVVAPVVPAETVTPPVMTDSSTMMDNSMGTDSLGTSMEGETIPGDAPMMADSTATM